MRAAALVVAAAALVVGCASARVDEPSPWIEAADAVCARHVDEFRRVTPFTRRAIEEIQERDVSHATFAEIERWTADFLAVGRRVEADIRALGTPPSGDQRRWVELNAENRMGLEAVSAAAARSDEEAVYDAFEHQADASEEFIQLSRDLDFETCGTVVSD